MIKAIQHFEASQAFTLRELRLIPRLLTTEMWSGSKDWIAGDMAERIEWLIAAVHSQNKELDSAYQQLAILGEKLYERKHGQV